MTKTFMGKPCKHGHDGTRYVSNRQCVECRKQLAADPENKTRKAEYDAGYRASNRQRRAEYNAQWRNKPGNKQRAAGYRAKHESRPGAKQHRANLLRLRTYDLTPTEYNFMLAGQNFRCANPACRADDPGGAGHWHTDHIHGTKIVRAILCHACNTSIGQCKESPAVLRALADYVERHEHLCPTKQNSIQPTSETDGPTKVLPFTAPNAKPPHDYKPATSSQNTNERSRRSA